MQEFLELPLELRALESRILTKEPLSEHTTFRVGGSADYFFEAQGVDEVLSLARWARDQEIPLTIIGNGSNLLVSDRGIRGLVIMLGEGFARHGFLTELPEAGEQPSRFDPELFQLDADTISQAPENQTYYLYVEAGKLLVDVSKIASDLSLAGLEFACGIPGSIGGALYMNAGAYGGQIEDVVIMTHALTQDGREIIVEGEDQAYAYRGSKFQTDGDIILGAIFALKPGDPEQIQATVADYTHRRTTSQPLEMPSAGSIFKRPPGYYAGKLISDCNLRGTTIGGAQVSTKHAGFIVNIGYAKADDIYRLIRHVQHTVWEQFEVEMETEVRFMGDWLPEELTPPKH